MKCLSWLVFRRGSHKLAVAPRRGARRTTTTTCVLPARVARTAPTPRSSVSPRNTAS